MARVLIVALCCTAAIMLQACAGCEAATATSGDVVEDDAGGGITAPDIIGTGGDAGTTDDAGPTTGSAAPASAVSLENGSFGVTSKTFRFEGGLAPTGSAFEKTASETYEFEVKTDLEAQE